MSTFEIQRLNMVESQVRPSDVTDRRILKAMLELPREAFVPEAQRALAYMDGAVPIHGALGRREMMAPRALARLIQLADIDDTDRVLHLAAGTGYATAILARLAAEVVAVETDSTLLALAKTALAASGVTTVHLVDGPLTAGWVQDAPYDAILIEGGVAAVSDSLLDQLKDGGRLVAIKVDGTPANGTVGRAVCWHRTGTHCDVRAAFDVSARILKGFEAKREFTL